MTSKCGKNKKVAHEPPRRVGHFAGAPSDVILYGLPKEQAGKLQRVLNTAARLLTGSYK